MHAHLLLSRTHHYPARSPRRPHSFSLHGMLSWLQHRRKAVQSLRIDFLFFPALNPILLERAAAALCLLAPSLRELYVDLRSLDGEPSGAHALSQLLAPIASATHLEVLHLVSHTFFL